MLKITLSQAMDSYKLVLASKNVLQKMLLGFLKNSLSIYDICLQIHVYVESTISIALFNTVTALFSINICTARNSYLDLAHLFSSLKEVHLYSYDQNLTIIHRVL